MAICLKRIIICILVPITAVSAAYYLAVHSHQNSDVAQRILHYNFETYGNKDVNSGELSTLVLMQGNSVQTSDTRTQFGNITPALDQEIRRALTRAQCLKLFLQGGKKAYVLFIAEQLSSEKLNYPTFQQLSQFIQHLPPASQEALRASCFIALSDKIKDSVLKKTNPAPQDSEQFISYTLTHYPAIYPLYSQLSQGAKARLADAFLDNTHARHMLYTEGGNNMFSILKTRISQRDLTQEQFDIWFARWIINIAGFRGNIHSHGSIYLTQNIASNLFLLKTELMNLQKNPNYPVLKNYLRKRANQLRLNNDNAYLAHLAALGDLNTMDQVAQLQKWFSHLSIVEQQQRMRAYEHFCTATQETPTFTPSLLKNLKDLKSSLAEAIHIYSLITKVAESRYFEEIKGGRFSAHTPLTYREIALYKNLIPLIKYFDHYGKMPEFSLSKDGSIRVQDKTLQLTYRR